MGAVGCADESQTEPRPDFSQAPKSPLPPSTGSAGSSPASPSIDGFWATYANEMDGTVVKLQANGRQVTGRGCLSGWLEPSAADRFNQCGEISGSIEGDQISFEFEFGGPGPWDTYGVHAQVLESGTRMNGEHEYYTAGSLSAPKSNVSTGPVTVFRPPQRAEREPQWPFTPAPMDVLSALAQAPQIALLGATPAGRFAPGTRYQLETSWGGLRGDIGVFAPVDLTYDRHEAGVLVVHAGPAPQAESDSPVSLTIEIRDQQVASVEAELASGEKLSFAP